MKKVNSRKALLAGLLILGSAGAFAQEELDDMFDDGLKSNSKIAMGTDVLGLCSGTIHAHVAIRPITTVRLQLGIGSTLIGRHIDVMNYAKQEDFPITDDSISAGLYYSAGIHIFPLADIYQNFYVYFDYRSWKYTAQEVFDMKKFKGSFGCGWTMPLKYNLSLEANLGVYLGRETVFTNANFNDNQEITYRWEFYNQAGVTRSQFFNGFDFGIGINYNL